jgi:hypothetical protein
MHAFIDHGLMLVAYALGAYVTFRWRFVGFLLGVILVWGLGVVRIELLYRFEPERNSSMYDAAWVGLVGWIVGAIWCSPFLLWSIIRRQRISKRAQNTTPTI